MNGPSTSTRTDVVANRKRILRSARDVFAKKGLAAEVHEIADKAGVGIGTIYRHFKSRDGLVSALIDECGAEILKKTLPLLESEDPAAAFREMLRIGAIFCERFGVFAEVVLSGQVEKQESDYGQSIGPLAELIRRGVEQGTFRKDLDIPVVITVAGSLFHGRRFFDLARQRSFIEAADSIADFLLIGMVDRKKEQTRAP